MEDNIYWSALFGDMRDEESQERCRKYIKENEGKKDVSEAYILLAIGIIGQREDLRHRYNVLLNRIDCDNITLNDIKVPSEKAIDRNKKLLKIRKEMEDDK